MAIDTETPARQATMGGTGTVEVEPEVPEGLSGELPGAAETGAEPGESDKRIPSRAVAAAALSMVSAAIMVGGVFLGVSPRIDAAFAGLLGIALGVGASRLRKPLLLYAAMFAGLFAIGLLAMLPYGPEHLGSLRTDVTHAVSSGKLLRPPADYNAGWAAVVGWIMGVVGFAAAWTATVVRRPSLAVLIPLPLTAIAGISLPAADQVATGIAAVAVFGLALGVLASAQLGASESGLPLRYELRRAGAGLAFMAVVTVALYGAAQSDLLFPHPAYDPTHHPEKPNTAPLSAVPDKVLFEVSNTHVSGPWVLGELDEYDGSDWRLPAFADTQDRLHSIPSNGIVDKTLQPGAKATFTIRGLTGAVLPGLPNVVAINFTGPVLKYDSRMGTIRLFEGQFESGYTYEVAAATVDIGQLTALGNDLTIPADVRHFEAVPPAPPAVRDLIGRAPTTSKFAQFDWLRHWVLDNVVASGAGAPVSIPPDRVQQIISKKQGSPYEIVATQALLARWIGLPSRIGYGFDGGVKVGDNLEVHPRNGSSFPEVYLPSFGWVPVVGVPSHARAQQGNQPTQTNVNVLPSNDISVQVYIPEVTRTEPSLVDTLRPAALLVVAALLIAGLLYLAIPVIAKALRRRRRRAAAAGLGHRAQIALAYTEWRDLAADFGYAYASDTPLMFAERFVADNDHRQFAWLVTRALWGDLGERLTPEMVATAENLSASLRRRLSQARPITVRAVALFSWRSLRRPYDADNAPAAPPAAGRNGRRIA
jgi:hypothetical protein